METPRGGAAIHVPAPLSTAGVLKRHFRTEHTLPSFELWPLSGSLDFLACCQRDVFSLASRVYTARSMQTIHATRDTRPTWRKSKNVKTDLLLEDPREVAPGDGEGRLDPDSLQVAPLRLRQHALGLPTNKHTRAIWHTPSQGSTANVKLGSYARRYDARGRTNTQQGPRTPKLH